MADPETIARIRALLDLPQADPHGPFRRTPNWGGAAKWHYAPAWACQTSFVTSSSQMALDALPAEVPLTGQGMHAGEALLTGA